MAGNNIIDIIIRATNKTKQALREPINDLTDLKGALVGASAMWAAAGTAALAAGAVLAKQALDAGDKALEMSEKLGITTEAWTTLEYAARKNNLTNEQLEVGLGKLAEKASQAATGNKAAADAFKAAGVAVTDAHGRLLPLDQILLKVSDSFAKTPNNAAKAQLAVELMGKSGKDMVPFLNQGAAGIQELQARARDLGLEISGPAARASDDFKDNVAEIGEASSGMGRTFMAEVLPGLNALLDGFLKGQGLGTAWTSILTVLGTSLVGVFKILMSTIVFVDQAVELLGAKLAKIMATVAGLATDGWRGAVNAWKAGSEEIDRINQTAKDRHAAIWLGVQPGPPAPDPIKNKAGFEEVLKQNEEAKVALDTQRWAELEAIRRFDQATVLSRLEALNAKRELNQREAEDFRALQQRKKELEDLAAREQQRQADERKQVIQQAWDALISLSYSKNSTLAAIGKTAAIAQATVSTYAGATKALEVVPFPFGFAAAAAIITAGLANVATIAGVPGFAAGGVVPGTDYTGDRRVIRVNSEEEVLTTKDRRETTAALLGALRALQTGGGGGGAARTQLLVDKRVLGEVIYEGTRDGSIQIHPRALVRT